MTGPDGDGSNIFSRALFHDISPAIKDLFDRRQEALFTQAAENSYIEIRSLKLTILEGHFQPTKPSGDHFLEDRLGTIKSPSYDRRPWECWSSVCIRNTEDLLEFERVRAFLTK